jgi:putative oxidoreductase
MSTVFTSSISESVSPLRNSLELGGRVLLAILFLMSGIGKIAAYNATAGYMSAMGVPAAMLPVTILLEIAGALAIIVGWKTRITAALLAGFTLVAAIIFHSNFGDQIQMIMFFKDVSIVGAFLMLMANGAGRYSLDARSTR